MPTARPSRRPAAAVLALLAAVLVVLGAGCSQDPPSQADLADALITSGVSKPQADCVAKAVYANLTKAQLEQLVERGSGGVPKNDPNRTDDTADRLTQAMARCQSAGQETSSDPTQTEPPVTTPGSGPAFTTTTTAP